MTGRSKIVLRTLTDRGQAPLEIARELAAFIAEARASLDIAVYDIKLTREAASTVTEAIREASARGIAVRLVYNVDHPRTVAVPPPPRTDSNLIRLLDFEQLWGTRTVASSGNVEPQPIDVGGSKVRAWFCPGHGTELSHRIARAIGNARERVRIASPVITAGPILGTLAEVADDVAFVGSFNLSHSGEMNAENVLEVGDPGLCEELVRFVDEVRSRYPPAPLPAGARLK